MLKTHLVECPGEQLESIRARGSSDNPGHVIYVPGEAGRKSGHEGLGHPFTINGYGILLHIMAQFSAKRRRFSDAL